MALLHGRPGLPRSGVFSERVVSMTPEIESARARLQAILSELEQACSRGETFSVQSLHEMHALTRFLQESGYGVETVRQGSKLVVEVEALETVTDYEWSA